MSQSDFALFSCAAGKATTIFDLAVFCGLWKIFYCQVKKRAAITAGGVLLLITAVLDAWLNIPRLWLYAVIGALCLVYSIRRYGKHCEKTVFVITVFYGFRSMAILVSDSIYQYLSHWLFGNPQVFENDMDKLYLYSAYACAVLVGLYMLLFLLMLFILQKTAGPLKDMGWHDVCFLSALNITGGLFTSFVLNLSVVKLEQEVFLLFDERREVFWIFPAIAVLLFFGELSAILIFQKYRALQRVQELHFTEQQQVKAMKQRLLEAEEFYGGIRKVRHEMKNHMTTIKGLVAAEHYAEVEHYIEKLDETIEELEYAVATGNAVTDVIINDRYKKAQKSGIRFSVDFTYQDTDRVPVFDLGIILGNLLDNAIEASRKVESEKRYVSLSLKHKDNFLLLAVENRFHGEIKGGTDDLPQTVKEVSMPEILMEHGVGLRNVSDLARRYLGTMDIKVKGDIFQVMVMLQQPELKDTEYAQ